VQQRRAARRPVGKSVRLYALALAGETSPSWAYKGAGALGQAARVQGQGWPELAARCMTGYASTLTALSVP
jgi:hypothetical protein